MGSLHSLGKILVLLLALQKYLLVTKPRPLRKTTLHDYSSYINATFPLFLTLVDFIQIKLKSLPLRLRFLLIDIHKILIIIQELGHVKLAKFVHQAWDIRDGFVLIAKVDLFVVEPVA